MTAAQRLQQAFHFGARCDAGQELQDEESKAFTQQSAELVLAFFPLPLSPRTQWYKERVRDKHSLLHMNDGSNEKSAALTWLSADCVCTALCLLALRALYILCCGRHKWMTS